MVRGNHAYASKLVIFDHGIQGLNQIQINYSLLFITKNVMHNGKIKYKKLGSDKYI